MLGLGGPALAQPQGDPGRGDLLVAQTDDADLFGDEELDEEDLFGEEDLFDEELLGEEDITEDSDAEDDAALAVEQVVEELPEAPDAAPTPLPAATAPSGPSADVEEILVQGQAGSGIEVEATVSVTQFDAEDLAAMGVEDVSDVAKFTPNLEIVTGSATAPTFFIRGIGLNDFTANASGAIAIYQDDVTLSLPAIQLGQVFDVEDLAVLRGPQGHGAARNASGGAIKIYSRKPTGDLNARLSASYGSFNERVVDGALGVPLLADTLAARVAFIVSQRDELVENRCGGAPPLDLDPGLASENPERVTSFRNNGAPNRVQPAICSSPLTETVANDLGMGGPGGIRISAIRPGLPEELDDADRWAARLQLRWTPPDTDMDWLLNVHGGKIDQLGRAGQPIGVAGGVGGRTFGGFAGRGNEYRAPEIAREEDKIFARLGGVGGDPVLRERAQKILARRLAERLDRKPFEGDYNRGGTERMATIGGFLRGDMEFDWGHLTSVSAVERYDRFRNLDADYSSAEIFEFLITDRAWQFSQELQLEGELELHPLRWHLGAYYLMDQLDYDQETISRSIQDLRQVYDQETWSLGAFGGFEWDLLDAFTLEAGIRFNWERKVFDASVDRAGDPVCQLQGVFCKDTSTWQDPSGTLKLSYHISDELQGYLSYTRGFKSGQYSVGGANGEFAFFVADPETVDAVEFGISGSVLDGMLDIQAAFFLYGYENYQVFLAANDAFTPPIRQVVNANDAVLYGAELETTLRPFLDIDYLETFQFTSRFGWIEGEFLDFTQRIFRAPGQVAAPPIAVDVDWTGNRLPNTPRFKWSGTLEYTLELGKYGAIVPRWDWAFSDDTFFDPSDGRGIPDPEGRSVLPEFAVGQKAYWLHNLRLSWRTADGNIEVAGWVRNLTNEVYKTLAFDATESANLVGNLVGDPRTYGGTISFLW